MVRPRPLETIQRDEQVIDFLMDGPQTSNDVARRIDVPVSQARLALNRLKKERRVERCLGEDGTMMWRHIGD